TANKHKPPPQPMPPHAIQIQDLVVHAPTGPKKAHPKILGPLSLNLDPGEHVLLVGPSGSGKTTLLRSIAGLNAPTSGTITIQGLKATEGPKQLIKPEHRNLGYLFQDGALWPHKTVHRTLDFVLSVDRSPRRERNDRIAEILELVELTGMEERLPSELSGGEAQRLNLARALITNPKLVLFDEPLGPLDAPLRAALLERIQFVQQKQGWCALHVTHDPAGATGIATRTIHIDGGQIVSDERHSSDTQAPA
ncbi:MAG: iron(III) transport system ATP-binding protein, partial [Bacteroidia bacterium]